MKQIVIACLLAFVISGCGKAEPDARFKPMFKDRAIVVLRDNATGKILKVDTFTASDLAETIVYTNGPSVRFVCFGDLVNPDVHKVQISGDKVEMNCQNEMIMGVFGNSLTSESALSNEFLEQVEERMANKAIEATQ